MRSLAGIVLPAQMMWVDQFASQSVSQETRRTVGGGLVVWHQARPLGRVITLDAQADACWMTESEVQAFLDLSQQPGASFPFVWDSYTSTVVFSHDNPPAFEASPLFPFAAYYTGRLRLLEV